MHAHQPIRKPPSDRTFWSDFNFERPALELDAILRRNVYSFFARPESLAAMQNANAVHTPVHLATVAGIVLPKVQKPNEVQPTESALLELDQASSLIRHIQSEPQFVVPQLSVIIPAFNELKTIQTIVDAVMAIPVSKQIIIVDDASTDGTREIIASLRGRTGFDVVLQERNQGKGAAIQAGIEMAKGDIVIVQDADLEYDPRDILRVIQPILDGETDVVFGSRYLTNSHQDQSAFHRFGNACLTGFSNWMTNQRLTDMETCYKAFRRSLIQSIQIDQKRFGFEPEITAKLARKKIRIREVAISYKSRSWHEGKKIGVRDLISTLWCIVRYRFQA